MKDWNMLLMGFGDWRELGKEKLAPGMEESASHEKNSMLYLIATKRMQAHRFILIAQTGTYF